MRKILYRGQHRRLGEQVRMGDGKPLPSVWCYGGILQGEGGFSIIYGKAVQAPEDFTKLHGANKDLGKWAVYSDTVGQYTGFDDINGQQIFEGDIIRVATTIYLFKSAVVKWDSNHARWVFEVVSGNRYPMDISFKSEVIGNIYDNPELFTESSYSMPSDRTDQRACLTNLFEQSEADKHDTCSGTTKYAVTRLHSFDPETSTVLFFEEKKARAYLRRMWYAFIHEELENGSDLKTGDCYIEDNYGRLEWTDGCVTELVLSEVSAPDDRFLADNIVAATFTSVWDGGFEETTACKVDETSKEVFDILDPLGTSDQVNELEKEYVTINGNKVPVVSVSHMVSEPEEVDSYWYN